MRSKAAILLRVFSILFLTASALAARADLVIQSAQYKAEKGALFVKGKVDSANVVYVLDADSSQQIASVDTKKDQFRADIPIDAGDVPCRVQIQTNQPGGGTSWWGGGSTNSDPGQFSIMLVRFGPEDCQ